MKHPTLEELENCRISDTDKCIAKEVNADEELIKDITEDSKK